MRVKLFTFRYSPTLGGFDDEALQVFVRDKEVVAFREHFFTWNDAPHLACVLTWQDHVVGREDLEQARTVRTREPNARASRRDRKDPALALSEEDRLLYNQLREWRAERAREEGVPPYVIFTNRELVEVVVRRPDSPTALALRVPQRESPVEPVERLRLPPAPRRRTVRSWGSRRGRIPRSTRDAQARLPCRRCGRTETAPRGW